MKTTESKGWHDRGYLPHYDTTERVQHVIFRCVDSLPPHVLSDTQHLDGAALDAHLDRGHGLCPLINVTAAAVVHETLMYERNRKYRLAAWCIMPNHVHVAIETLKGHRLGDIVKTWKSYSARRINAASGKSGAFWARDYFDRYARNERHLATTIAYIEDNPVKVGLANAATDWPWSSASCEPRGSRSR